MSNKSSVVRMFLRVGLPALVIVGFIGISKKLKESKVEPEQKPTEQQGPLVTAAEVQATRRPIMIQAQGSVIPARVVEVQPEVSGQIVSQHPHLIPGGVIEAGETLVQIDERDYRLRVEQQQAAVERAAYQLQVELGRQSIAEREWKLLEKRVKTKTGEAGRDLALRKPQIRNARAELAAAKSAVRQARLSLERARIKAPFNAMIRAESVEVGQVVAPGRPLATLVGTDAFWVQISVPETDLRWIPLPDADGEGGAKVKISPLGRAGAPRAGRVVQLLGDLDPVGRMARLLVEVRDPTVATAEGAPPLLLGAFVEVSIEGRAVEGVIPVPRVAMRPGDELWIARDDNTLEIRKVEVAHRTRDEVLVRAGVKPGERVITSRVAAPITGMKIRIQPKGAPVASVKGEGADGAQRATP